MGRLARCLRGGWGTVNLLQSKIGEFIRKYAKPTLTGLGLLRDVTQFSYHCLYQCIVGVD
jgi:hypothetical protein